MESFVIYIIFKYLYSYRIRALLLISRRKLGEMFTENENDKKETFAFAEGTSEEI